MVRTRVAAERLGVGVRIICGCSHWRRVRWVAVGAPFGGYETKKTTKY